MWPCHQTGEDERACGARRQNGFYIDPANGKWLSKPTWRSTKGGTTTCIERGVRLFTTITADTLYVQPMADLKLDADGVVTFWAMR